MDDMNKVNPEEEFHFSNEVPLESNPFGDMGTRPAARFGGINRRTVLLLLVILILGFLAYQFGGSLLQSTKKPVATDQVTVSPQPVLVAPPVVAKPMPSVPQAQVQAPAPVAATPPAPTTATPDMQQQLAAQQASNDTNRAQIQTLQGQVANLETTVNNMKTTLASINDQLHTMASAKAKVFEVKKRPKHAAHQWQRGANAPRIMYNVQAMIPGRAWLVDPDGLTLTVTEGDKLPGYGRILSINPARGRISTSSGRVISYEGDG